MKINKNFIKDKWLSKTIGKQVYLYKNYNNINLDLPKKTQFTYIKINKKEKKKIQIIKKKNFKLINYNITFEKKITQSSLHDKNIRLAKIKDKKKIQNIAFNNFNQSRFSLDKKLKKKSKLIKSEWVNNYFKRKRGDALFLIEHNKTIAGFVLLIYNKQNLIIDLIAIDSKYQRKGLGIKLINFIQSYYYKKFKKIIVGTQLNNKASLKFYKRNKFRILRTEMVFHKHF